MNNKKKTVIAVIGFAAFLMIVYIGYTYLSATFRLSDNPTSSAQGDTYKTAADFTVFDEAGNPVKLSDFSGKPIVLNFWASWCPPCKSEMPHFNSVYANKEDEVVFLMVDLVDGQRETKEKGLQYVTDQAFDLPVYFDTKQEAAFAYGISSIPTTFLIDAKGNIVTSYKGAINEATLIEAIKLITN